MYFLFCLHFLMDDNYLSECLIYKASVSTNASKYYYGTCENTFKERFNYHNCSFRKKTREKNTKLSKYIWEHMGIQRERY